MVTNIVAPIFVGFLMEGAGRKFTALFIAVWNVVSALLEYSILVHVYTLEPALSVKANSAGQFIQPFYGSNNRKPKIFYSLFFLLNVLHVAISLYSKVAS